VAENRGLLGEVINSQKTVYRPDVNSDPDYVPGVGDVKSEVCIPIILGNEILGILDVESMEIDDFTSEDISTLEALADIMAVAIKNSYLFEESIQKAERLALIDNINRAISATLDLDSFFRVVARAVSDNAGYRWTCLVVPSGDSFIFKAGYTPKSVGFISAESMLDLLREKLTTVINRSAPEFLSMSEMAALGVPEKLQSVIDAGIRSLALFPIGDNARAEAVMIVGSARSEGFSSQELLLLKDLAVHLRIAWQNAQLYRQLKNAYEQLQEAQERIIQTEKLRALGEMSSGVAHDFNNILAAIIGRLQIIASKLNHYANWSGRQFLTRNLELIEKAANDGAHILSRIREFTGKKVAEKYVGVQLGQIIKDTIELTRPRWHNQELAKGRQIEVVFSHDDQLWTTGNPTELREVFTNLINNAVDAIKGDGKIVIDARNISDREIMITLEDNGSGMSPETCKKIFEPFFTTKGTLGTGLGLSITYGIISRHKGMIEVESEPGKGTKFTIRIPIRECSRKKGTKLAAESQPSRNILIVDDDEGFREILVEILMSCGHKADFAPDAGVALEMLESKRYDLVITDLGMSGLSGWELADAVHELYPDTRIIMATGCGADLDSGDLAAHHVSGLIGKPCRLDEVMRTIDEVLTHSGDEVLVEQD
jgi:signal transduction histidine kinase/CheY-like chemotaxis protein